MTAELALAVHVLVSFPTTYLHWCIRVFTLISAGGVMYDLQFQFAPRFCFGIFWLLEALFSEKLARKVTGAGRVKLTMANMDAEGDGEIELEEFLRAGGSVEDFESIDVDGSGTITLEELDAHQAAGHTLYQCDDHDDDKSANPYSAPSPAYMTTTDPIPQRTRANETRTERKKRQARLDRDRE